MPSCREWAGNIGRIAAAGCEIELPAGNGIQMFDSTHYIKVMENQKSALAGFLTWIAVSGNILFILWILYNGIREDFQGTPLEKISYISLMGLLAINAILLVLRRAGQDRNRL